MKRRMTAKDLWALPRVGSPEVSPDGSSMVVPVTAYTMESDDGATRLWRVPTGVGTAGRESGTYPAVALTPPDLSTGRPAISPDGSKVAFAGKLKDDSAAGELPQLNVISLETAEHARLRLPQLPFGVSEPRWLPDSRSIAFLSKVYIDAPTVSGTEELKNSSSEKYARPYATEDKFYRHWDRWLIDGKATHIFVLHLASGNLVDLTPDNLRYFDSTSSEDHYSISPDGLEIAFSATRSEPPHDPLLWGVFTVKIRPQNGPALLNAEAPAHTKSPLYSPDGRHILYGWQQEYDNYADRVRLAAYDRERDLHSVLTEHWDRSASCWRFADDSGTVFLAAEHLGRTALFSLNLHDALADPSSSQPKELGGEGTFSLAAARSGRIFGTFSSLSSPPEVRSCDFAGENHVDHTAFTKELMRVIDLAGTEEIVFEGAGGDPVRMFVLQPRSSDKKKLPLVHMVHGGPHGTFGNEWHWRWNAQLFCAPGYLTALVNFHGSTSWGSAFTESIKGRWGDQPYVDIMAATDYLVEKGLADENRMAVAGGSYGGYLVSWIASQTARFSCIVNHAGVIDFQTQYASDITQGRGRSTGGELWKNLPGLDRYNPMRHADGFASPMLILHGEKDYRVPYAQALEIYNVYKARKLPARLVFYPDENHFVLKPRNSCHWYGEVLSWLERWLTP